MARQISQINSQITTSLAANFAAVGIAIDVVNWSKRNILRLICYTVAIAISVLEQLIDAFTANVELIAATAAPASPAWLVMWINQFQYSATVPQIIQFTPQRAPYYPSVSPSLQIISRVSVTTDLANNVLIKVATGSTPAALSTAQLTALQAYVQPPNGIGVAGINYIVTSGSPDLLYLQANIYYNGQYSTVIQANVVAGVLAYLAAIPFNGQLKLSDLEMAIRNVAGITDVLFVNVSCRDNGTAFGSGTNLVVAQDTVARLYNFVAGYAVGESTSGSTLNDTITYIPS